MKRSSKPESANIYSVCMNGGKWRKLEAIYHDALAQPIDQRAAFVASACGNDTSLAREIESLLAHEGEADEQA